MVFWKRKKEANDGVQGRHNDKKILESYYGPNSHTKIGNLRKEDTSTTKTATRNDFAEQQWRDRRHKKTRPASTTRQDISSRILAPKLQRSFLGVCDEGRGVVIESGSGGIVHRSYSMKYGSGGGGGMRSLSTLRQPGALSGIWSSDESPSRLLRNSFLDAKEQHKQQQSRDDDGDDDLDIIRSPSSSNIAKVSRRQQRRQDPEPLDDKTQQQPQTLLHIKTKTSTTRSKKKSHGSSNLGSNTTTALNPRQQSGGSAFVVVRGTLADSLSSHGHLDHHHDDKRDVEKERKSLKHPPNMIPKATAPSITTDNSTSNSKQQQKQQQHPSRTKLARHVPAFELDPNDEADNISDISYDIVYSPSSTTGNSMGIKEHGIAGDGDKRDESLPATEHGAADDQIGDTSLYFGSMFQWGS